MFKRHLLLGLVLLSTFAVQASPKDEITMLVVPRDAKTIQIAQDISDHYPVIIVSYQQTVDRLKLHAWNGTGWVGISVEDYGNGAFFENPPHHAILIQSENKPASEQLIPDGLWCKNGNRLTSTDPRVVIHLLGRYLDFPNRRWKEFAGTYGYQVGELNPALVNIYWWQYPPERPKRDLKADMENWLYLDITPPPPVEPVVIEEEPGVITPVEVPAGKPAEETVEPVIEGLEEAKPEVKRVVLPEESVEAILNALKSAKGTGIDPFSTDDIPAAKIVLPKE